MYLDFFGLSLAPFNNTPDPTFYFESRSHCEALASMIYGIEQGKGFIMITGDVGTGKTLLVQRLKQELEPKHILIGISNPWCAPEDVLEAIRASIEAPVTDNRALNEGLRQRLIELNAEGRRVVLIIDEAHQMSPQMMEGIRLLSNIETTTEKLIQIVFIGQNELADTLASYSMRQIQQRLFISHHLDHFTQEETIGYIKRRIQVAGGTPLLFPADCIEMIHREANGTPRVINHLCDNCLLFAFGQESPQVTREIVNEAVSNLRKAQKVIHPTLAAIQAPTEATAPISPSAPPEQPAQQVAAPADPSPRPAPAETKAPATASPLPFKLPINATGTKSPSGESAPAQPTQTNSTLSTNREGFNLGSPRNLAIATVLGALVGGGVIASLLHHPAAALPPQLEATHPAMAPVAAPPVAAPFNAGAALPAPQIARQEAPAPIKPEPSQLADSAKPAGIALPSLATTEGLKELSIPQQGGLASLATAQFGVWNETVRDLIAAANPELTNQLDSLPSGSKIRIPTLSREMLLTQDGNGQFYVFYGTFNKPDEAQSELNAIRRIWPASQLISATRNGQSIQRLFVGAFPGKAQAKAGLESLWFKHLPTLN